MKKIKQPSDAMAMAAYVPKFSDEKKFTCVSEADLSIFVGRDLAKTTLELLSSGWAYHKNGYVFVEAITAGSIRGSERIHVVEGKNWYNHRIAPEGKSFTYMWIFRFLSVIGSCFAGFGLFRLWQNEDLRNTIMDTLNELKAGM